jgi:hypothetical protein
MLRDERIWREFLRLAASFDREGMALVPLKGTAFLADIYRRMPVRPMTDLDVLIEERHFAAAASLLSALGYRKELYGQKEEYWRNDQCHVSFTRPQEKDPFPVEVHWGIDFKRKGRALLPELWTRLRTVSVDGQSLRLLSPEDSLFCLALHNRRYGKTLCLKNAYDVVLMLHAYAASFDWDYLLRQSRIYELASTVFFILTQAKLLSDVPVPDAVWPALRVPAWKRGLIRRFIENNTFRAGRKSKDLYLKSHFLLYDSFWEPVDYIIHIPKEQFANFYSLKSQDKRTDVLYRYRYAYIPFKACCAGIQRMKNGARRPGIL